MGIYDVGYGGFGSFKSDYRISNIPKAPVEEVKKVEAPVETPKTRELDIQEVDNRSRSIDPNNVSLSFNKGNDFSYIGRDKDILGMDMKKAISDMKQDSILHEYNYFVGNSANVFKSDDGTVFAK
mgnify:CR=1 FL=1